jgi:hypothetical protein
MPLPPPEQPCIDVPERCAKLENVDARASRHCFQRAARYESNARPSYHARENAMDQALVVTNGRVSGYLVINE